VLFKPPCIRLFSHGEPKDLRFLTFNPATLWFGLPVSGNRKGNFSLNPIVFGCALCDAMRLCVASFLSYVSVFLALYLFECAIVVCGAF